MKGRLHWNTVSPLLRSGLQQLMAEPIFDQFRLVGGTALSLLRGHRMSVDIDLFTDAAYGDINFQQIDAYLRHTFAYISPTKLPDIIGMGTSYIMGESPEQSFKLDLYYTDPFIFTTIDVDGIRLASDKEIAAMKIDVVQRGGRKKDFWDIHSLLDEYTIEHMMELHEKRYPYWHDVDLIKTNLIDFTVADEEFDPICLLGKHWELIKLDFYEMKDLWK